MATHRTASGLARALEERFARYARAAFESCDDVLAKATLEDAIELTSGSLGEAGARAAGNPFGRGPKNPRGRVRGRVPLLPINKRTGRLQQGLKLIRRDRGTGRFSSSAEWSVEIHGVDYARYVVPKKPDPRSKMLFRPLWEELDKRRRRHLFDLKREFRHKSRSA